MDACFYHSNNFRTFFELFLQTEKDSRSDSSATDDGDDSDSASCEVKKDIWTCPTNFVLQLFISNKIYRNKNCPTEKHRLWQVMIDWQWSWNEKKSSKLICSTLNRPKCVRILICVNLIPPFCICFHNSNFFSFLLPS